MGVCIYGFCNVWCVWECVCVGFLMCGCLYVLFFNVWLCLCMGLCLYGFQICGCVYVYLWLSVCTGFVLSGCVYEWVCLYLSYLMSLPDPWRFSFILSSRLSLGFPNYLVPSNFPTKTLYTPLISPTLYTPRISLRDYNTQTILGEQYRSLNSSLCSFLHSSLSRPFLNPNFILSTLFSNTLIVHSSPNVSDQYSHQSGVACCL